jgi:arabinose-5-phosphate isomerase
LLTDKEILQSAKETLKIEAKALLGLITLLNQNFIDAVKCIHSSKGRVIVSGIGKSANVANKIVATLNSTGTPAVFMHAADALHGDLGIVLENDIVIVISNSGNSPEIKVLIPFIKSRGNKVIAIVGKQDSFLAVNADFPLNSFVEKEACGNNLAPTSSTTAQMALGDALAVALIDLRGFSSEDFAKSHPGGALGKRLFLTVEEIIDTSEKPRVNFDASLKEVIYEISSKRLGATAVFKGNEIIGMITDGDIRRMLGDISDVTKVIASDIMCENPKKILSNSLAVDAMEIIKMNNITQVIVVNEQGYYKGMLHLHELIKEGISD